VKINQNPSLKMTYEEKYSPSNPKNKPNSNPKKSQSDPIKTQFKPNQSRNAANVSTEKLFKILKPQSLAL